MIATICRCGLGTRRRVMENVGRRLDRWRKFSLEKIERVAIRFWDVGRWSAEREIGQPICFNVSFDDSLGM